jgi:adenylate kinase family enzyme
MTKRLVRVVRHKPVIVDRAQKDPTKQRVAVLRRLREGETYVHKDEIPVSIGIPEYCTELRKLELTKRRESAVLATRTIIFLMGGPAAGKKTQARKVVEKLDIAFINTGELLRGEAASESESGRFIDEQLNIGAILPTDITIPLVRKEILRQDRQAYLIGGFPRKVDQATTFEKIVCPAACLLWLEVPDHVLLGRPQDSTMEDSRARLKAFHELSEPVYGFFHESGRAVKIDGNRDENAVFTDIARVVTRVLNQEPLFPAAMEQEEPFDLSAA